VLKMKILIIVILAICLATIISVNGQIGGIYWGYNPYGSLGYYNPYHRPYAGGYGYGGYVYNGYGYGRPYRPYRGFGIGIGI